jgi:hypothetical protein
MRNIILQVSISIFFHLMHSTEKLDSLTIRKKNCNDQNLNTIAFDRFGYTFR